MRTLDKDCFARVDFELSWHSSASKHRERYLARKVNLWRDIFPAGMDKALMGLKEGDSVSLDYSPEQLIGPYQQSKVKTLSLRQFSPREMNYQSIRPSFGRFYPKGFLNNVIGIYPENYYPFRVIGLSDKDFVADLNHPLAQYPVQVTATVLEIADKDAEFGGRCTVWMEAICDCGPGMQARWQGQATDFLNSQATCRDNEEEDIYFYQKPRLVGHVDSQSSSFIQEEYARFLSPGMRVLDLMSSVQSHLPMDMGLEVVGLGLNQEEMDNNPIIQTSKVYDLNAEAAIPFTDKEFDGVVCSLSIEYLLSPEQIMKEIARVLKPNGPCLISFSNRWFPPKVTALWTELHEFERMGLVQEYFFKTGAFDNVSTFSVRNWWRPETDPRYPQIMESDPVFIVSGVKKSS
jgi:SAM-dependent methyltransferase/FKBP-type peptidyl-prolyl cis-trans isomerase 2